MRLHRTATVTVFIACTAGWLAACASGLEVHRHQMKVWMDGPQAEVVMACTWPSEASPFDEGCLDLTAGAYEGANTWWISGFSTGRLPWNWTAAPAMDTLFVACQRSRPVGLSLLDDTATHVREVQLVGELVPESPDAPADISLDEARELAASLCDGRMGEGDHG